MSITGALDTLATNIQVLYPTTRVTRDPSTVLPPCIHIGLPSGISTTLKGALVMDVPVYLVGTQPGDQPGMDPLLDMLPDLMRLLGVRESQAVTLQPSESVTYPAYRTTARIHAKPQEAAA